MTDSPGCLGRWTGTFPFAAAMPPSAGAAVPLGRVHLPTKEGSSKGLFVVRALNGAANGEAGPTAERTGRALRRLRSGSGTPT